MSSNRFLLAASPSSSALPSPPVSSGFNCLCPNPLPHQQEAITAPAPFSFDLRPLSSPPSFSFPPLSELPSNRTPKWTLDANSVNTAGRFRSKSAQECNPTSNVEPRMLHSRSADEHSSFSFTQDLVERSQVSVELAQSEKNPGSSESAARLSQNGPDAHLFTEMRSTSLRVSNRRDAEKRVVFINNPEQTNERYVFAGNKVRTSKYTVFSFLPRNLFEQFHRIAYIYFLVIAILNQLPQLAVFGRTVSLFPLLFVLIVTAIKDGYEDWRRHRSDKKENNRLALVLQAGEYNPKKWKHIQVGEMVKVTANETIPCDMVLLSTSEETGVAYVQTINLDGESNLKTRYARQETAVKHPHLAPLSGRVICEEPNRNIYGFTAYMELEGKQLSLGPTNVILRGCQLKNTSWAVGVVVYAGQETKAMLNSSGAQSKRSRLEQSMNKEMWWLSVFLLVICFVGALGLGTWLKRHKDQLNTLPYFRKKHFSGPEAGEDYNYYNFFGEAFFGFLSFVIIFQVMIPISLYISMELVRVGQSFFMIRDVEMYHSSSNSRFQCRALNINEDLGQIKYVFSDKTGTLTENKMEFRKASIHGVTYSSGKATEDLEGHNEGYVSKHAINEALGKQAWKPKVEVKVDPALVKILQGSLDTWERKIVHEYLLTLAACNTVVPIKVKSSASHELEMEVACAADSVSGLIEYQGESPDEQALVSAAAAYGYTLLERTSNHILIDVLGKIQRFQVLGMHEFDSLRKCMATVLECPDKTIKVLVKGADTSVLSKLAVTPQAEGIMHMDEGHHAQFIFATRSHLDLYSRQGLRTLVVAGRELEAAELENWKYKYNKASTALVDRGALLQEAAKIIEKDLLLLGATGIEDKLQDGVPEAIAALREAGIHVWVLTGDKQETAISIGFSCSLLTDNMHQIIINENEKESCHEALINAMTCNGIRSEGRGSLLKRQGSIDTYGEKSDDISTSGKFFSSSISEAKSSSVSIDSKPLDRVVTSSKTRQPLALIIDGNTLVHALEPDIEQELYDLATACKVVLCCRVAPLQKAGIVSLVKRKARDMTLAIGDGANDVSMIQMADVGVGISGQEGRQAVMASDFAMGQFRFLKRLLLVHGHWNYNRLGYMVLYNFYRNAVFIMMLFWYIFYNAFSPLSAITDWSLVFYSLIYTSLPTVVVAILDKDISYETLLRFPSLYSAGQQDKSYNKKLFWLTMLDTLWQSLVLFYIPFFTFQNSTIDIWGIGSIWTIAVVILVNLHLAMDIQHWTWISHMAVWGSIAATYISLFILDSVRGDGFLPHYWVVFHVLQMGSYWLDIFLVVCLALLPRFCVKVVKQNFWPSDSQIAREAEILLRNKREAKTVELNSVAPSMSFLFPTI